MFAWLTARYMSIRLSRGSDMFILDVYGFCEGAESFTWKNLARFIYTHRECARLSKHAEVSTKFFAESAAKEFIGRMCTLGYLDMKNGAAFVTERIRRPFNFDFRALNGNDSRYIKRIMELGEMSDEEFFNSPQSD